MNIMQTMTQDALAIPKLAYAFWAGDQLSALHALTIQTFCLHNPDWRVAVYTCKHAPNLATPWATKEQSTRIDSALTLDALRFNEQVEVIEIDFPAEYQIPVETQVVHLADLTRIIKGHEHGGLWIDLDIIFCAPIPDHVLRPRTSLLIAKYQGMIATGLFAARPQSPALAILKDLAFKVLKTEQHRNEYQSLGPVMWTDAWAQDARLQSEISFFPTPQVYPYLPFEIEEFTGGREYLIQEDTFAMHWYNGAPEMRNFINKHCAEAIDFSAMPEVPAKWLMKSALRQEVNIPPPRQFRVITDPRDPGSHFIPVGRSYYFLKKADYFRDCAAGRSVLHVGCAQEGLGNPALHLAMEEGAERIDGVDTSSDALRALAGRLRRSNGRLQTMDQFMLSPISQAYDVLVAPNVLAMMPNALEFLQTLARIPFTTGFLTVPCAPLSAHNFVYDPNETIFSEKIFAGFVHWYSPFTLAKLLQFVPELKIEKMTFIDKSYLMVIVTKAG